ncbi:MAG: hypothetical protein K2Q11_00380 [Burkholderiaceae bacterium]|nr:hypothetical protein [Burkholderiaceae bacterium]
MPDCQRTIACTPNNAAQMQAIVKSQPALLNVVKSLQTQGLFPGLRGLSITLTGSPEFVQQGLDALTPLPVDSIERNLPALKGP